MEIAIVHVKHYAWERVAVRAQWRIQRGAQLCSLWAQRVRAPSLFFVKTKEIKRKNGVCTPPLIL